MKWDDICNNFSWKKAADYFSDTNNDYTKEELLDAFLHMSELHLEELVNGLILEDYVLKTEDEKGMEKIFQNSPKFEEMDCARFNEPDVRKRIQLLENYLESSFE